MLFRSVAIIFCLLFSSSAFAEKTVDADSLVIKNTIAFFQGELFTGTAVEFYKNGQKHKSISYREGRIEGIYLSWYENGQKKAETPFVAGKAQGEEVAWYPNGDLKAKYIYVDGKLTGKQQEWYENGQKSKELLSKNNNIFDSKEWYENGQEKVLLHFEEGATTTTLFMWHENGQQQQKGEIKKVDRVDMFFVYEGERTDWYPDGKVKTKYTYLDNQLNGPFTEYYPSGALHQKGVYKNGRFVGVKETYHPDGKTLHIEQIMDENSKRISFKKWDESGNLIYSE